MCVCIYNVCVYIYIMCVCVYNVWRVFVTNQDIDLYNEQVWHRYYKVKVTFRTLTHVPTFQNAYKSYRVRFFWGSWNAQSPVRAKFRYRVGVGNSTYSLYSIKTITPYGMSPLFTKMNVCVCVCVCVYIYIYIHTQLTSYYLYFQQGSWRTSEILTANKVCRLRNPVAVMITSPWGSRLILHCANTVSLVDAFCEHK